MTFLPSCTSEPREENILLIVQSQKCCHHGSAGANNLEDFIYQLQDMILTLKPGLRPDFTG